MREISLQEYVNENTQAAAATALGRTQGAIWQMLRDEREVYIVIADDGSVSGYEKRMLNKKPA